LLAQPTVAIVDSGTTAITFLPAMYKQIVKIIGAEQFDCSLIANAP